MYNAFANTSGTPMPFTEPFSINGGGAAAGVGADGIGVSNNYPNLLS